MAWVALDRAIKGVELMGNEGPVDRWRAVRRELHDEVCREGYDAERDTFVQFYGSDHLDASLLQIPLVGFLPAGDPRVQGTVAAIQRELTVDGLVHRYPPDGSQSVDGLPPGEGTFLACTFWLADNLALMGRREEARVIFERLLTLRNDVGLLAEEYDAKTGRLLGNFPQAFSHVARVNPSNYLPRPHAGLVPVPSDPSGPAVETVVTWQIGLTQSPRATRTCARGQGVVVPADRVVADRVPRQGALVVQVAASCVCTYAVPLTSPGLTVEELACSFQVAVEPRPGWRPAWRTRPRSGGS